MKPAAASELQRRRLLNNWWWYDPRHACEMSEAALAWETVRRTRAYRALWRRFKRVESKLLQESQTRLAGALQRMHFFQGVSHVLGKPFFDYLMQGFDPALTWMDLEPQQRRAALGFVPGNGEVVQVNPQRTLPGQVAERRPHVSFGFVELDRDGEGRLILSREIRDGFALRRISGKDFFRQLGLKTPGMYVAVCFDIRAARDATLQTFDEEASLWLGVKALPDGRRIEQGDTARISATTNHIPIVWNAKDKSPVAFWTPEFPETKLRAKGDEVAVVPSEIPGLAIMLISARHNPATVRAALHTRLKGKQAKEWQLKCIEAWEQMTTQRQQLPRNPDGSRRIERDDAGKLIRETVAQRVFDTSRHLPSDDKPVRSNKRKAAWLGLAANDLIEANLALGKSTQEGRFLLEHCFSMASLHNAQRSIQRRLGQLEKIAEELDADLAKWSEKADRLEKGGFYRAAAVAKSK